MWYYEDNVMVFTKNFTFNEAIAVGVGADIVPTDIKMLKNNLLSRY